MADPDERLRLARRLGAGIRSTARVRDAPAQLLEMTVGACRLARCRDTRIEEQLAWVVARFAVDINGAGIVGRLSINEPEGISEPCIGFGESDELFAEMRQEAHDIVRELLADDIREIKLVQEHIHDGIGQLVYDRTRRRPMILPVVVEV